jgi:hypothetical protein
MRGAQDGRRLHALVLYVDDEMIKKIDHVVALHKKVEEAIPIDTGCASRAGWMRQFLSEQFKGFDADQYQKSVLSKFGNMIGKSSLTS